MNINSQNQSTIPTVKQGAIIGGWLCFALGCSVMYFSLWGIIFYAPLFMAAFILSILAMSQRRILGGILLLLATLIVPLVWCFMFMARINEFAGIKNGSTPPPPQSDIVKSFVADKAGSSVVPEKTSASAVPPETNASAVPETDTSAVPEADPNSSKYAGKYLQVDNADKSNGEDDEQTITSITSATAPIIYEINTLQPVPVKVIAKELSTREMDYEQLDEFSKKEFTDKITQAIKEQKTNAKKSDIYCVSDDITLPEYDFAKNAFPSGLLTDSDVSLRPTSYRVRFANRKDLLYIPVEISVAKQLSGALQESRAARITYIGTIENSGLESATLERGGSLVPIIYMQVSAVQLSLLPQAGAKRDRTQRITYNVPTSPTKDESTNKTLSNISSDYTLTGDTIPYIYEVKVANPTPMKTFLEDIYSIKDDGRVTENSKQKLQEKVRQQIQSRKSNARNSDLYAFVDNSITVGDYNSSSGAFLLRGGNSRTGYSQLVISPSAGRPYAVRLTNMEQFQSFPLNRDDAATLAFAMHEGRKVDVTVIGTLGISTEISGDAYDLNCTVKTVCLNVTEIQLSFNTAGQPRIFSYSLPPIAIPTTETSAAPSEPINPTTTLSNVPVAELVSTLPNRPPTKPTVAIVFGIKPGDSLNVRATPASSAQAVFQLVNGAEVQIRGESAMNGSTEWVPISADSQEGWVVRGYLREVAPQESKPPSGDQIKRSLSNLINEAGTTITKAVSDSLDLPAPSPTPVQGR